MVVVLHALPARAGPAVGAAAGLRAPASPGLSDSMTPGNIANLIQSDALAFRVQFEDDMPPYQHALLARPGDVDFDGATWKMTRVRAVRAASTTRSRERPGALHDHARAARQALALRARRARRGARRAARCAPTCRCAPCARWTRALRYEMISYLDYRYGEDAHRAAGATFALRFDETRNPRTVALGRQWARGAARSARDRRSRAFQLLQPRVHLHARAAAARRARIPSTTSCSTPSAGFCEHYAGSFALLMRAAGIPARVVTGYQGGEVNPAQQRADRAPGRRARVDRDLARRPGLGAHRSHRLGLAAARRGRRERRARPHRRRSRRSSPPTTSACSPSLRYALAAGEQPVGPVGGRLQRRPPAPVLLAARLSRAGRLAHARLLAGGRRPSRSAARWRSGCWCATARRGARPRSSRGTASAPSSPPPGSRARRTRARSTTSRACAPARPELAAEAEEITQRYVAGALRRAAPRATSCASCARLRARRSAPR